MIFKPSTTDFQQLVAGLFFAYLLGFFCISGGIVAVVLFIILLSSELLSYEECAN